MSLLPNQDSMREYARRLHLEASQTVVDITRPAAVGGIDAATGTMDTADAAAVASDAKVRLLDGAERNVDVAGDPQALSTFRMKYDPDIVLQVDDRVDVTAHSDAWLVGKTLTVISITIGDAERLGMATVQLTQPDRSP